MFRFIIVIIYILLSFVLHLLLKEEKIEHCFKFIFPIIKIYKLLERKGNIKYISLYYYVMIIYMITYLLWKILSTTTVICYEGEKLNTFVCKFLTILLKDITLYIMIWLFLGVHTIVSVSIIKLFNKKKYLAYFTVSILSLIVIGIIIIMFLFMNSYPWTKIPCCK